VVLVLFLQSGGEELESSAMLLFSKKRITIVLENKFDSFRHGASELHAHPIHDGKKFHWAEWLNGAQTRNVARRADQAFSCERRFTHEHENGTCSEATVRIVGKQRKSD
jgi:hypothetical protein